jgi:hypothetical protein
MKNLLGTCLGHSAIYAMASMLQTYGEKPDYFLLRGAIFFISMSLWGPQRERVTALKHTPVSVLPSINKVSFGTKRQVIFS